MSTVVRTESCFMLRLFHVCHKYGSRATLVVPAQSMQGTFGSVPLQNSIRFLLPLMSAPPSAHLATCFPLWGAIRIYPVPLE